jgi:hypothetical protein
VRTVTVPYRASIRPAVDASPPQSRRGRVAVLDITSESALVFPLSELVAVVAHAAWRTGRCARPGVPLDLRPRRGLVRANLHKWARAARLRHPVGRRIASATCIRRSFRGD